jgi:hypothetical protein
MTKRQRGGRESRSPCFVSRSESLSTERKYEDVSLASEGKSRRLQASIRSVAAGVAAGAAGMELPEQKIPEQRGTDGRSRGSALCRSCSIA